MRTTAILSEAWRNLVTGTTRAALFAVLLALLSAGLAALEVTAVQQISAAAHTYVASGASVLTLRAPGRISGSACEALDAVPGVRAAGALRSTSATLVATVLPSSPLPEIEVTGGVLDVLRADDRPGTGVVLSQEAAASLSVVAGDDLSTRAGGVLVTGTYAYPSDGREPGYGYAVLAPVAANRAFDECWADVWPQSREMPVMLRTTLLPAETGDDRPVLSQLNGSLGARFDGTARFDGRATRFAAPLALLLAGALGYVSVRRRRLELASALHAGMRRWELAAMLGIETLAWVLPAVVLTATAVAALLATGPPLDAAAAGILGARIGLSAVVGPFLGALAALARTNERRLFQYFKDR